MTCAHLEATVGAHPPARTSGCEECLAMGETWVHLRQCLACGHLGCCNSSKNKHAAAHFLATGHPVIRSFEPGETWRWCYVDRQGEEV
ncbi:MAG TPA: UBP-type zinc finger domain-containing protein [Sandaracinaceae bacterium]